MNWQDEASLDVEWVHSIAPKANIVIEIMPTQDWDEFEFAIDYARTNKLGGIISNSYGYPEALFGAATVKGFEQVLKKAAAAGLAVNFSTGQSCFNNFSIILRRWEKLSFTSRSNRACW